MNLVNVCFVHYCRLAINRATNEYYFISCLYKFIYYRHAIGKAIMFYLALTAGL